MSKQIEINTFDDLITFIETQNASAKDIEYLISKTLGVFVFFNPGDDKTKLIQVLKDFWNEFKNNPLAVRPILLLDSIQ